jgi:cell wall-associated NlpC family hydrolase
VTESPPSPPSASAAVPPETGTGAMVSMLTAPLVGYALPVPSDVVTADPRIVGEGSPGPRQTEPAGPVTLPVATGTAVDAVTAGTLKVLGTGGGTSTVVLSGTDGATYTYRNVTVNPAQSMRVKAGNQFGISGPGGLTFSISVPDVRGAVDAHEALQAWASGLTVDVRALPSTIPPANAAPAARKVQLVTDTGAATAAADLAKSLAGQMVGARTSNIGDARSAAGQVRAAQQIAAPGGPSLVVAVLANGTPAQAAVLAARLPAGHDMLWVAPPGTTPKQSAAYQQIAATRPGFRAESLPAALAAVNAPLEGGSAGNWSQTGAQAAGTLAAAYASTAYRLESQSSPRTVVNWAEERLGKTYQWGAAGPDSFDCSGLSMDALNQAGIMLPHDANAQWQQTKAHPVAENRLALGDLVFYTGSDGSPTAPGHVGIYIGNGEIIDAPYSGADVRFEPVTSVTGYVGATDPFAVTPVAGTSMPVLATGAVATPASLNQYETFARNLADSTWGPGQFPYLYMLWERESGWNPAALNPLSGAFGIPQALPASKMASAGPDWATNADTQIIWGIGYIRATYGTPQAAWAHELAYSWY